MHFGTVPNATTVVHWESEQEQMQMLGQAELPELLQTTKFFLF